MVRAILPTYAFMVCTGVTLHSSVTVKYGFVFLIMVHITGTLLRQYFKIFKIKSPEPHMLDTNSIIYKATLFMNLSSVTEYRVLNVLQMCH
jgi:hypothetical protein